MRTRLSGIALAGLIAALGVAACGGGDDDSGKKESSSKKSDSDETPPGSKDCGPKVCKPTEGFMGELCCRSHFDGTCGQMVAGSCTDLPPAADKRCKSTMFMVGANPISIPSCCTDTNECGLVFTAGIGTPMCTSITTAKMTMQRFMTMGTGGMMMFNFTGNLPDAVTCDGKPIEGSSGAAGGGM